MNIAVFAFDIIEAAIEVVEPNNNQFEENCNFLELRFLLRI